VAVVLAFRLAILVQPSLTRWIVASAPVSIPQTITQAGSIWARLNDPSESDAALSDALSAETATVAQVTTFSEPFETRRLQVSFRQLSAATSDEDVRVITFHLLKVAAGVPQDEWVAGDFTAARDALLAFWTGIKNQYPSSLSLTRTAFYKEGPDIEPPQPPVNAADHTLPGTHASTSAMPPQVALTVTEQVTGNRKNWGRFYLPPPVSPVATLYGRPGTSTLTQIADAADVMYQAWLAAGLPGVVYLPALPERSPTASDPRYVTVGTFPPRPAVAMTVDQLQVDDIYDVIRSRRYDRPTLRVQRAVS
jgi:hypothetical protein